MRMQPRHVCMYAILAPQIIFQINVVHSFGGWRLSSKVLAHARLHLCREPESNKLVGHTSCGVEVSGENAIHVKNNLRLYHARACEYVSLGCYRRDRHIIIIIRVYV